MSGDTSPGPLGICATDGCDEEDGPFCEGCGSCGGCCNCSASDCDCDTCKDRWDRDIEELDARDGDTDLEDCDTEPGADEDGACNEFGGVYLKNEDDEPDGPADRYDEEIIYDRDGPR